MKSNLIRLSAVVMLVVFIFSLAVPASASGWDKSNITVIDYLDYADSDHLEIDTNQSFVVIDIPADHAESVFVQNIDNKDNTFADGTSDTVMIPSGDNTIKYLSFPTLDYHYTENRTRDGYLFDVSNFPQGTTMSWEWTIEFTGYSGDITNLGDSFDYWCYFFNAPDEYGWSYRGGRTSLFGLPAYDDTKKIVAYCEYKHGSSTVGSTSPYVAPLIRFESLEFSKLPAEITVKTSSVKVMIPITDDLLDLAQSEKTQKMLNEINNQLAEQGKTMDDLLNGTPEQNEIAGNISDALTDKGEQLGGLIDDMQTEKPNLDSVDVDKIIPSTGITTLSSAISPIAENPLVIKILVMVGTLLLVSYVLFGKKG